MRFGLLKRRVSEAVRLSEPLFARMNPSQNLYRLSQPLFRSSLPVPEQFARATSSSLELTPHKTLVA
ncbi:hypothetical protein AAC387_Pa06g1631 [Persea americana]